ncbi:hypothetical protein OXX59_010196, partial [Metschnikowia pulcherrima]
QRKAASLNKLMKDLDIKDGKKAQDSEVLSDYEEADNDVDEDTQGEVERDDDEEVQREYTFPEDRQSELGSTEADLQARYQAAFEASAKPASSKTAETIAQYIQQ